MKMLHKHLPLFVAMLIVMGTSSTAQAQSVVGACNMNCPALTSCAVGDLNCAQQIAQCEAEELSCQAKYDMYDLYATNMGMNVSLHNLPQLFKDVLGPYFPNANLSQVRFGHSNQPSPNTAMTDCDKIYFNGASYVDKLQDGTLDERFSWLLHELRHFEQCKEVGGRDDYAKMWWDHLSETELNGFIQSGNWDLVHDQMQLEQDAVNRKNSVLPKLRACCIHPTTNRLVRPLQVTSMYIPQHPKEGFPVTFSIDASQGADPLVFEWSVKAPGPGSFDTIGSTATVSFTPDVVGTWQVRVQVLQADGSSDDLDNDYEDTQSFTVEAYVPLVANLTLSKTSIYVSGTIKATVYIDQIIPGATVKVDLSSSSGNITVPSTVLVTGGSGNSGIQTFDVTAQMSPPHTATITASVARSTKSASLTIVGLTVESVVASIAAPRPGDWFDVRVKLNRPPPTSITVVLESSDAQAVRMPRQITFKRGEQEKTIRAQAGSNITRAKTVTLKARMDIDRQQVVQTQVRVRPRGS